MGRNGQEEVDMAQNIEDGDWIRFPSGGSRVEGKVIEAELATCTVRMKDGGYTIVAMDERVEKIDPPEGEE